MEDNVNSLRSKIIESRSKHNFKELPICPLFLGGCCPSANYSEYSEVPYYIRKKEDKECCKAHRELTKEELNGLYGTR